MSAEIRVRPWRMPEDFEALVRIVEDAEEHHAALDDEPRPVPHDIEHTRQRFRRIQPDPDTALLVAEVDGEVVGLIEAAMRRDEDSGFTGVWIQQVAVAAAWRGRGAGTRLIEEVERWATARGAMSAGLDCFVFNTEAQRLYERLGFVTRALRMGKRLPAPPQSES